MESLSIGPLVLPLDRLVLLLAAIALLLGAHFLEKREPRLSHWATAMLLAAIGGGRAAYVLLNPGQFLPEPWTALYFWQDGYLFSGALIGMALVFALYCYRGMSWRWGFTALTPALVVGLTGFAITQHLKPDGRMLDQAPTVYELSGEATTLAEVAAEQETGVFLWATWCGVCRQMLPDVAEAARQSPDSRWILLNVGEQPTAVTDYIGGRDQEWPDNLEVLLDPKQEVLRSWQAHGVPTTLLFDEQGEQTDRFMGRRSLSRLLSQ